MGIVFSPAQGEFFEAPTQLSLAILSPLQAVCASEGVNQIAVLFHLPRSELT
jgi:hypothetical protein